MPIMDGMELLRKVREEQPEVQVIMMTADGSVSTAVRAGFSALSPAWLRSAYETARHPAQGHP
ncbi:MAG: response regulator [Myxococcota bacterium]